MVILGVGDGIDAGAALVIDDQLIAVELQERHDRVPRSRVFPWAAIEEVLEEAGLRARHVDEIAIAGRFSPPLFVRRHPGLRRMGRDPFSPAVDASVFFQAMLRQSGLGALEADRAVDWAEELLRGHGFAPQRVTMVDVHKALAEAAYRTQPRDDVLVITLHPMGDGAAMAVHRGTDGQLDRLWIQRGFATLHVHLARCAAAMRLDPTLDAPRMWGLAGEAEPDPELVELLSHELRAEGLRLSRRPFPLPEVRTAPVYRMLSHAEPEIAAASVLENLARAVTAVVRAHVERTGCGDVALGGSVFENPRLCAAVADLPEVTSLWVQPTCGFATLPIGAAASLGGLAPHLLAAPGLGRQYHERQFVRALGVAGIRGVKPTDEADAAAGLLAEGQGVARFQGRGGHGRHGGGTRSVLVRADDAAAVERVRTALRRPDGESVHCLWTPTPRDGAIRHLDKVREAARYGGLALQVDERFAERYPAVVTADGRVLLQQVDAEADPSLHRILQALHRRTGCAALACLPLSDGVDPVVAVPGDAIRVWRRSGVKALMLGPFLVQEPV